MASSLSPLGFLFVSLALVLFFLIKIIIKLKPIIYEKYCSNTIDNTIDNNTIDNIESC